MSDVTSDIEVLLEVTKGDNIIWHGITSLTDELDATFRVPHFSFDAPLPEASDVFSEDDAMFPGRRSYFFWCGDADCSVEQKTLCKALYGAHSAFLTQRMPPIRVRVVLRRRSNGQMVTIISNDCPNHIFGEDYFKPIGSYDVSYHSESSLLGSEDSLF